MAFCFGRPNRLRHHSFHSNSKELITLNVTVSWDKVFRKYLGLNKDIRMGPQPKQTGKGGSPISLSLSLFLWPQRKGYLRRQREDSHPQARQRELTRNLTDQHFDLRLPGLQNCKEINICCLSQAVYSALLWQLKTNTKRNHLIKERNLYHLWRVPDTQTQPGSLQHGQGLSRQTQTPACWQGLVLPWKTWGIGVSIPPSPPTDAGLASKYSIQEKQSLAN